MQDEDVTREAKRVTRIFQRYTPEQRANRAAAHTLTPGQQKAVGEYLYTHPDVPGKSFGSRQLAARAAVTEHGKRARRVSGYAAKFVAETVAAEPSRHVEPTDEVLAAMFADCARPAPADLYDEIRAAIPDLSRDHFEHAYARALARQAELAGIPEVAAVSARVEALTVDERRRLDAAWREHFRLYRVAQLELGHRCAKAWGENYHDVLQVADDAAGPLDRDGYHGARHAAADYVKALIWGIRLLAQHERPILTGPWLQVIGSDDPPAQPERFVSAWATA